MSTRLPAWARLALVDAARHALSESDWLEHGPAKCAAWTLDGFARFVDDAFGRDRPAALATLTAAETTAAVGRALAPGFVERDGLYDRLPTTTAAQVARGVAEAIGVTFARGSTVRVPRVVSAAFTAAARRAGPSGDTRALALLRAARDAGQGELAARIEAALAARPPLGRVLDAGTLSLEAVLGIVWTDDEEASRAAISAQLQRAEAQAYAPTASFQIGDVLAHPKLGRGIVIGLEDTRYEVRFADGERKLARVR